jgi:N-methylhydantoinase A
VPSIEYSIEARYSNQVWEINVPLGCSQLADQTDVGDLVESFHRQHERLFAVRDDLSPVEIVNWCATSRERAHSGSIGRLAAESSGSKPRPGRSCFFPGYGSRETAVTGIHEVPLDRTFHGPVVIETPFTTIVIPPEDRYVKRSNGNLVVTPAGATR